MAKKKVEAKKKPTLIVKAKVKVAEKKKAKK